MWGAGTATRHDDASALALALLHLYTPFTQPTPSWPPSSRCGRPATLADASVARAPHLTSADLRFGPSRHPYSGMRERARSPLSSNFIFIVFASPASISIYCAYRRMALTRGHPFGASLRDARSLGPGPSLALSRSYPQHIPLINTMFVRCARSPCPSSPVVCMPALRGCM